MNLEIVQEAVFWMGLKAGKKLDPTSYWIFNTPKHPFEIFLRNKYKL